MSIKSIKYLTKLEETAVPVVEPSAEPVSTEEATTIVNETTTRIDPEVPAIGAPVEPEPQEPEVVDEQTVELPEEVTPAEVEEAISQVEEAATVVEENGVTPETMRFIEQAWGDKLQAFGLTLPKAEDLKRNSINLRAAAATMNSLIALKNHLKRFKRV